MRYRTLGILALLAAVTMAPLSAQRRRAPAKAAPVPAWELGADFVAGYEKESLNGESQGVLRGLGTVRHSRRSGARRPGLAGTPR
jgi:hypothetical protein